MYYHNKIVGWAASPIGMLFLGLGIVAVCAVLKRRRLAWIVGIAFAVLFWFLGCSVATRLVGAPLEVDEVALEGLPKADAIVLLGGGMGAHEKCGRAEMFGSADRVWTAAKLFKAGLAPKITLSGGGVAKSTVPLLEDLGVPENAMLYFDEARNTEEEAKCISAAGITNILLVTSAWHMPRARLLFERKGFVVTSASTDYEMHYVAEMRLTFADFLPNADSLGRNSYALKEWVARLGYAILRR